MLRKQRLWKKEVFLVRSRQNNLTEGPIWKSILLFAMPVLLGNIFQQFYNTFDSWCVGNFIGGDALAAVSSSGSLIHLMVGFFNGVAMGAGVIIARYFGAKNYEALRKAIHTDVAFGLATGILLSIIGVTFSPTILRWMGTPEEVLPQSVSYFRFYFCGAVFTVMYNIFVGILHALGDSRHPLYYLMISTMVNVVLDLLFVAVLKLGVGAAALATTISQGISALLCCIRLTKVEKEYCLILRDVGFDIPSLRQIVRIGLPSGVQNSAIALANLVVQTNINSFGKDAMAGCGAYSKIEGFAFLPITCFTMALSTFVSQNLGARKYDRVKKGVGFGIVCCVILAECVGLCFYRFAPSLISFFNDAPEVVEYGTMHMRTICLFYCLLAFSHCLAAILRGAGRTTVPMATMLVCWCLIRVSYITIAVQAVNHLTTVSRAYPITWTCSSIVFLIYFLKVDWMHGFEKLEQKAKT